MGKVANVCVEEDIVLERIIDINNNPNFKSNLVAELQQEDRQVDSNDEGNGIKEDDWLPMTESRKGNSWTSTFLLLSSGIGIQSLSLPLSFLFLGWYWGILCLSVAFAWQLYTIGLLVSLHETVPGTRHSRYLHLSVVAFGEKMGKFLAIFPLMYLSGGTCVMFIITGGGTMKLFYQLMRDDSSSTHPFTSTEWYLLFTCLAITVALVCPNLHSVSAVAVLGAITAVGYCTIIWSILIAKGRPDGTIYDPSNAATSEMGRIRGVLNGLGLIALAFRGHNVVLEIQGTIPSGPKNSSSKPMWRGVATSYVVIAMCFFPLAICGYWAYGNKVPINEGMLMALSKSHHFHTSKTLLGLTYMLVVISCVAAFQIYGMVIYDNLERLYTSRKKQKCSKLIRSGIRVFFGGLTYFISVAIPFLGSLSLLIGGIALPLTFAYPCFMWLAIKKPPVKSVRWWLNLGLGCLGIVLSVMLVIGAVWNLICRGLDANFFRPH